jgi:hypothetical protein
MLSSLYVDAGKCENKRLNIKIIYFMIILNELDLYKILRTLIHNV